MLKNSIPYETNHQTTQTKSFVKRILSDHGMQYMDFLLAIETHEFLLYGATWNILNQCKNNGHPNNPFQLQESNHEYEERLTLQFKEIETIIHPKNTSKRDFIFLQETHFLIKNEFKNKKRELEAMLEEYNYKLLLPIDVANDDGARVRPIALIYNANTLTPRLTKNQHPLGRGLFFYHPDNSYFRDYCGYEWEFIHNETQQVFALTNMHLAYKGIFNKTISNYLREQEDKKIPTILGGDTNHVPSEIPEAIVGNKLFCTNIGNFQDSKVLTIMEGKKGIKQFDIFITSHQFKNANSHNGILIKTSNPYGYYFASLGGNQFMLKFKRNKEDFNSVLKLLIYGISEPNVSFTVEKSDLKNWYNVLFQSPIGNHCVLNNYISPYDAFEALKKIPLKVFFQVIKLPDCYRWGRADFASHQYEDENKWNKKLLSCFNEQVVKTEMISEPIVFQFGINIDEMRKYLKELNADLQTTQFKMKFFVVDVSVIPSTIKHLKTLFTEVEIENANDEEIMELFHEVASYFTAVMDLKNATDSEYAFYKKHYDRIILLKNEQADNTNAILEDKIGYLKSM